MVEENKFTATSGTSIRIKIDHVQLDGVLSLPKGAKGIVVFAHGSGSSRFSPRNSYVAKVIEESGFGTLLSDLLTGQEDRWYENRFNIDLLAQRLASMTLWLMNETETKGMNLGYFGASTGAAAALQASIGLSDIRAIVSRGGRPDLASPYLSRVRAPTLLVVGERDEHVLGLNQEALGQITAEKQLVIVPGASHLFEEAGALEEVARLAAHWFIKHL